MTEKNTVDAIDDCLPQTQCTQCGYPRCRDYAQAIAKNEADINQCPPGNIISIELLAGVTRKPKKPLNPTNGVYQPRRVAFIIERECIGCTLCIQVCPVDAISGAGKSMHTVIAAECSGCDLCLPACPVDCIDMISAVKNADPQNNRWPDYTEREVRQFRQRTEQRIKRLNKNETSKQQSTDFKHEILAAVERVRARRVQNTTT